MPTAVCLCHVLSFSLRHGEDQKKMDLTTSWNCPGVDIQTVSATQRCEVCTKHTANRMFVLHEHLELAASPLASRTWRLCEGCAAAVVTEMQRTALYTPLRVRIAVGMVAAERRPPRRLMVLSKDFWEQLPGQQMDRLIVGLALCMFVMPPLLFLLVVALTVPGVAGR
jgi:hypothetical protein